MQNWITLTEAARRLGVRAQTVYAYASRGTIAVIQDPDDPRRSLYRAEDVVALCRKKQVGRKRAALAAGTIFGAEPCIYSGITTFSKGRAWYRGRDSIQLAESATLEETAALLWQATAPVSFDAPALALPPGEPDRQCAFTMLATLAANGHSTLGRLDSALHTEAGQLVAIVSRAFGAHDDASAGPLCTHQRLAAGWALDSRGADLLRCAMVLVADHEITSSAFAARITASTGASLAGCLLTGLATLSGPLHGDASGRVRAMFDDVQRLGAERVVDHHLRSAIPLPGFGHHLYPDGDPRAAALLARLDPPAEIAHFVDKVTALTGLRPTIDVALAMLSVQLRLPRDAAFGLFSIARSVGLLAHCIEQLRVGKVIRPRSRYTGPALDDRHLRPAADDDGKLPKAGVIDKNRVFKVVE
ncbi:citrate synthase [Burkholderia cenocepacia]|uniref:citrate/2-methylcitrate synthase n=1 Tax=Burkholderia TaxID=32008 RepID=UPI000F5992E6|nr:MULTISPECIES: citrate synthase family protein [unclassified Burkholderia]RQU29722.1 citrate synthase [Burkholderia cenocepacia]QVN11263.1 citrate synthase family protein [Burkholderia sp. LAS2]RQU94478.1 citrate synthase [Burkholderia cenocepacia]RQV66133.1 citrate synthase [Burkholderia cenocepacia]RQV89304.1 citrate synthase [Burkholderia cenocepacia]